MTIRQLRKQIKDDLEHHDQRGGELKEQVEALKDHNVSLQGGIDNLEEAARQEREAFDLHINQQCTTINQQVGELKAYKALQGQLPPRQQHSDDSDS